MKTYISRFFGRHTSPEFRLEQIPENKITRLPRGTSAVIELSNGNKYLMPPTNNGVSCKMIVLNEQDFATITTITKTFEDSVDESEIRNTMLLEYVTAINSKFGTSIQISEVKYK